MPRVPLSVVALSTALLMLPGSSEARSLRYALHSAIFAPFGAVAGMMGIRHRSSSHRHRLRYAHHQAGTARTAVQSPPVAQPAPASAGQEPRPRAASLVGPNDTAAPANVATGGPWAAGYDDLFGYVFTPGGGDAFWQHGAADLRAAIFPNANTATTACLRQRPEGIAGWPNNKVEQTLRPTDVQRSGLDKLHGALDQAFDRTQYSCSAVAPASASARLEALSRRLEALRDAARIVRGPLSTLYASLTDEQKARLNIASRQIVADNGAANVRNVDAERLTRDCMQDGGGATEAAAGLLMRVVQPAADQRQNLEIFAGTFGHVVDMLKTSCPADMPLTPMGRLSAAEKRLRVMLYAITILRGPLDRFQASLTDEQRARFDETPGVSAPARRGAALQ